MNLIKGNKKIVFLIGKGRSWILLLVILHFVLIPFKVDGKAYNSSWTSSAEANFSLLSLYSNRDDNGDSYLHRTGPLDSNFVSDMIQKCYRCSSELCNSVVL